MRRSLLALHVVPLTLVLAAPSTARADVPCEPGSWFCGETQPPAPKQADPLPAERTPTPLAAEPAPPVVVYAPPPPPPPAPREVPPPYYFEPQKATKREWGLNVHAGVSMMGKGAQGNAGMALGGLGLRLRPIPSLAFEGTFDLAAGRDYHGDSRSEAALSLNALIFLNPKGVAQLYVLGGLGTAAAVVRSPSTVLPQSTMSSTSTANELTYRYFGAQAGVGIEFRLSRAVALNVDLRGLIRTRTDRYATTAPEFRSSDGKTTNTSGAGLLQAGLTFYW